jgi:mono/diheme cytochrome c family protein
MFRIRNLTAVALALGLVAMVACSGSEAGQAASGKDETSATASGSTAMADGHGATQDEALPEGVTPEMVAQGKEIYAGVGLCYVCHGGDGTGMPGMGANLTDDEWIQADGTYESIVKVVTSGVDTEKSTTGIVMPPKGGSSITDDQVKAVAAYVYTLGK